MPDLPAAEVSATLCLQPLLGSVAFVSDLHLSPTLPLTVAAFTQLLQRLQADALFILGDLFEVWVGDDALEQPFEAACVAALRDTTQRMPVYVMRGNRDFLLGPRFFEASHCVELPDPVVLQALGRRVLLTHGDALCLDDTAYQTFRRQVRDPAWQSAFLARPMAERLALANQMRGVSRAHQAEMSPADYADADPELATHWLAAAQSDTLIHGHTHRPGSQQRPEGWTRHVLSDWDLDHGPRDRSEVLCWNERGFERHHWTATGWS